MGCDRVHHWVAYWLLHRFFPVKRIKLKGGDEYDVHTGWRKFIRPPKGMIKRAKRTYNKRFRKDSKEQSTKGLEYRDES